MVVGDSDNDNSMFSLPVKKACPYNATETIKSLSDYVSSESYGNEMNITIDRTIKRSYCKNCKAPYKDIRISLKNKMIVVHCPYCGDIRRIPFKKQKNNF